MTRRVLKDEVALSFVGEAVGVGGPDALLGGFGAEEGLRLGGVGAGDGGGCRGGDAVFLLGVVCGDGDVVENEGAVGLRRYQRIIGAGENVMLDSY